MLDAIIEHSRHLLVAETNILFFIKAIRFKKTLERSVFLNEIYSSNQSVSIKRGCIECWGKWKDRTKFISLRNSWELMPVEEQRMLWFIASNFNDDGFFTQKQIDRTLQSKWSLGLGIKNENNYFVDKYIEWAKEYE